MSASSSGSTPDPNLKALAEGLPAEAYSFLERPPKYAIKTAPRQRPEQRQGARSSGAGVRDDPHARGDGRRVRLSAGRLHGELSRGRAPQAAGDRQGAVRLREEYRYFFFITNDRETPADEIVFKANDRCDQENLIAQLKGGVHALKAPVDNLVSNWAYMVMASLAWTLKAWAALLLPEEPRHAEEHRAEKRTLLRMEFATFRAAVIEMPCQIVRGGRRLIYRLLSWNPWQGVFLRLVERLQGCWLC